MDWGRVIFTIFSLLSTTSLAGFLYEPNIVILFTAMAINLIATTLKIGVQKQFASELMGGSLVALLHLLPAFVFLQILNNIIFAYVLVIGALISNVFCLILLIIDSTKNTDTEY
ncbi:DUF6394 family protein [Helicobacter bizzozeronii]|uniref:Integral membrane protein n=1 Tax=Helicobacter bizzozeronii (strain CIII-1) TaxID=1002804 RepID=F8KRR5_HELBC|nr:DUF6394 family protein [Helicobacter bizzozeronii]GMB93327.1 Monovalent Cation:Proton Antiporter-3 Cpa3 [Helicobacter bizzozeronii]GMT38955.1 Monovalent Cation:Proton Antiporter-3 Cpa3 [Helicobacter bizzozeronii]CCB79452.1 FIG00710109: hypothetical protein [Helicobacter bizzozeronii CIII-1]CCF79974.1 FIG00710109: hypothetical protein [Helicobacter bizzozeronii CCUG 35545]